MEKPLGWLGGHTPRLGGLCSRRQLCGACRAGLGDPAALRLCVGTGALAFKGVISCYVSTWPRGTLQFLGVYTSRSFSLKDQSSDHIVHAICFLLFKLPELFYPSVLTIILKTAQDLLEYHNLHDHIPPLGYLGCFLVLAIIKNYLPNVEILSKGIKAKRGDRGDVFGWGGFPISLRPFPPKATLPGDSVSLAQALALRVYPLPPSASLCLGPPALSSPPGWMGSTGRGEARTGLTLSCEAALRTVEQRRPVAREEGTDHACFLADMPFLYCCPRKMKFSP